MPNFIQITPFMHVRELEPALTFFHDLLGFTVPFQSRDYAYLQRESVGIRVFAHDDEYFQPGNRAFRYYIDVRDVDALVAELKPRLATLPAGDILGPIDQPYGQREFMILAPDGDLVVFGQAIQSLPEAAPTAPDA